MVSRTQPTAHHRPPLVSACMIVRNEEAHLARCLQSIAGLVDDIVIVDTGSTDSTVEIARSFGAQVSFEGWCDDFSHHRNQSWPTCGPRSSVTTCPGSSDCWDTWGACSATHQEGTYRQQLRTNRGGMAMPETLETKVVTLRGTSIIEHAEMLEQLYFDTSRAEYAQYELCLSYLSGCTLVIDAGDADAQAWSDVLTVTDMSSTYHVGLLSRSYPPGDSRYLRDRLRWYVDGGANWEVCFYLTYEPLTIR